LDKHGLICKSDENNLKKKIKWKAQSSSIMVLDDENGKTNDTQLKKIKYI